jgi:hypothetical protein
MRSFIYSLVLTLIATSYSYAQIPPICYRHGKNGMCGRCAYNPSVAGCISCGVASHGAQHTNFVTHWCQTCQPACGH